MKREELNQIIKDYLDNPTPDKENELKSSFKKCLESIVAVVREVNSNNLELDGYDTFQFRPFYKIFKACDNMTSLEIDSIDTGSESVILKITPSSSGSLLAINKDYLCDEYVNGCINNFIESVKNNYQKEFDLAKKQYDEASAKLLKASTLKIKMNL